MVDDSSGEDLDGGFCGVGLFCGWGGVGVGNLGIGGYVHRFLPRCTLMYSCRIRNEIHSSFI